MNEAVSRAHISSCKGFGIGISLHHEYTVLAIDDNQACGGPRGSMLTLRRHVECQRRVPSSNCHRERLQQSPICPDVTARGQKHPASSDLNSRASQDVHAENVSFSSTNSKLS